MKSATLRFVLRWMHIILGLIILCYIYSPFHQYAGFRIFVKWFVVPFVVISGVWIWKFALFNKKLKMSQE